MQQITIVVPRGQNVGRTIQHNLEHNNLRDCIDIETINPTRDIVNKRIVVDIEYKYKVKT